MKRDFTRLLVLAFCCAAVFAADAAVVRDIAYDSSIGQSGLGDLYLPEKVAPETPVVLTIHGGGWRAGSRLRVHVARVDFRQRRLDFTPCSR